MRPRSPRAVLRNKENPELERIPRARAAPTGLPGADAWWFPLPSWPLVCQGVSKSPAVWRHRAQCIPLHTPLICLSLPGLGSFLYPSLKGAPLPAWPLWVFQFQPRGRVQTTAWEASLGLGLCLNPHPQSALGTEGRRLGTYKIATSAPCEPPRTTLSGRGAESLGRGWHGEVTPKVLKLVVMGHSGPKRCLRPLRRTSRPTRGSQSLLVQSSRPDFPFGAPGPGRRRSPGIEAPVAPARCSRLRLRLRFPRPGTERPPPGAAGVAGGGAALGPGHPDGGGCRWAERCAALGPAALPARRLRRGRARLRRSAGCAPAAGGRGGGPGRMPLPGPPRRPLAAPRLPGRVALAPHSRQPRSPSSRSDAPWSARQDPPTPGPLGSGSLGPPPLNRLELRGGVRRPEKRGAWTQIRGHRTGNRGSQGGSHVRG